MPILLILLVVIACLPVGWPGPPFGLSPAAAAGPGRPFPSRPAHWLMPARRFATFVLLPAGLTTVPQAVTRFVPREWLNSPWFALAGLAALAGLVVLFPFLMTSALGMVP